MDLFLPDLNEIAEDRVNIFYRDITVKFVAGPSIAISCLSLASKNKIARLTYVQNN